MYAVTRNLYGRIEDVKEEVHGRHITELLRIQEENLCYQIVKYCAGIATGKRSRLLVTSAFFFIGFSQDHIDPFSVKTLRIQF
jgi:hypothetical protein